MTIINNTIPSLAPYQDSSAAVKMIEMRKRTQTMPLELHDVNLLHVTLVEDLSCCWVFDFAGFE
jgi:hypothetical protein